ncbi:hypothetical protein PCE1_003926 [Barthelona sp. PCE]
MASTKTFEKVAVLPASSMLTTRSTTELHTPNSKLLFSMGISSKWPPPKLLKGSSAPGLVDANDALLPLSYTLKLQIVSLTEKFKPKCQVPYWLFTISGQFSPPSHVIRG